MEKNMDQTERNRNTIPKNLQKKKDKKIKRRKNRNIEVI